MEQTCLAVLLGLTASIGIIPPDAIDAGLTQGGQFVKASVVKVESFGQHCWGELPPPYLLRHVVSDQCEPIGRSAVGSIGHRQFQLVRYKRTVVNSLRETRIESTLDQVLVIELAREGWARPIWSDFVNTELATIDGANVIDTPNGAFLDVRYCWNGTGGCVQLTLIERGGKWARLRRDSTWAAVYEKLPTGYRPAKSEPIDFRALRWTQSLAAPGDANCCPSGYILFTLDVRDDLLTVKDYRIVVPTKAEIP